MNKPVWRGKKELLDLRREFMRQHLPTGSQGFVVEDLDLLVRRYGPTYSLDDRGEFFLAEIKCALGFFGAAQRRTFGLLDQLLKSSSEKDRYKGFFMIYSDSEDWSDQQANPFIYINQQALGLARFIQWLNGKIEIQPISPFNVGEQVRVWSGVMNED